MPAQVSVPLEDYVILREKALILSLILDVASKATYAADIETFIKQLDFAASIVSTDAQLAADDNF